MVGRLWVIAWVSMSLLLSAGRAVGAELVGEGKVFVRFTNTRPDDVGILVRVHVVPNHNKPFGWNGVTVYVGADGAGETAEETYLVPGEASPWIDVGQYMNLEGTRSWATYLSPLLCGVLTEPKADGLYLLAEVAQGPGTRVIRRVEVAKPELASESAERDYPWHLGYGVWNHGTPFLPTLGLLVPSQPDVSPRVYTLKEAMQWQLDVIEDFPDVGRLPTQMVFRSHGRPAMLDALGYNGYPPGVVEANLGDEISIKLDVPEEEQNARFRETMKAKGLDPLDLMGDDAVKQAKKLTEDERWGLVTLTPALPDKPVQYYESAVFRYRLWYETLAAKTQAALEEHPGKRVLAGANFSPHMNVWPDVRQWVGPFKAGAMTMCWTEDWWWQLPEASPQVYGFLLDGFRLANSYHGAPIQFYIMPFKGNSPDNFRRMHALALAHGVKIINHFHTENQVLTTWDYVDVSESPRTYQAIHDMIRDVGAVEHRLYAAMPAKADAAILLSWAADTWDTEDLGGAGHLYSAKYNVNNDERKALWMALRHAQYPVDLITDEDVAEGRLEGYRVLYVVGAEMLAAAAAPLEQWVNEGGIVYATAGGGLLDEYHRPQKLLHEMYGIKRHELVREVRHIRPRNSLPKAQPLDTVRIESAGHGLDAIELPALLYRETLTAAAGETVGRYASDGGVAAVVNRYGQGTTFYLGALAGIAYLAPAMPPSSDVLPTDFLQDRRDLIAAPLRWAEVVPPVRTSDPLVEAQYLEGDNGAVVTLTNWRQAPVDQLVIQFPGRPELRSVRSLRAAGHFKGHLHEKDRGHIEVHIVNGAPRVTLRLEVIDFLLLD